MQELLFVQTRKERPVISSTTVYVELSGDSGTWLPAIDSHTQKPLVSKHSAASQRYYPPAVYCSRGRINTRPARPSVPY